MGCELQLSPFCFLKMNPQLLKNSFPVVSAVVLQLTAEAWNRRLVSPCNSWTSLDQDSTFGGGGGSCGLDEQSVLNVLGIGSVGPCLYGH